MVKSFAKINLVLKILDRRADGYHNLFSLFQRINLWDEITFDPSRKEGIFIESSRKDLPTDGSNLVYQAAESLLKKTRLKKGIGIFIRKNIPVGAGLGGGSSNAAVTLVTLNQLWNLNYSVEVLARMGETLGSDIPFFCYDCSSAWVTGRGEKIQAVSLQADYWILLVFPGFSVKTGDAYLEWDRVFSPDKKELTKRQDHNTISSFQRLKSGRLLDSLENDFETVIFLKYPVLKEIRNSLIKEKAEKVLLSGSGSTLVGIYTEEKKAREAGENLRKRFSQGFICVTRFI